MTSQYWGSVPARGLRVWGLWVCTVAMLLPAVSAVAEPISVASYDSWQWNGFSRTVSSAAATNDAGAVPSLLSNTVSSYSASSSATSHSPAYYLAGIGSVGPASAGSTGSLSGYVFVDVNNNGIPEPNDWAIVGAQVELSWQGSTETMLCYTDENGAFSFTGLPAGTCAITMLTPCDQPGKVSTVAELYDKDGNPLPPGNATVSQFTDIVMPDDATTGINYAFGELVYPIGAYSKRLLIDDYYPHYIPEPSSLALLAAGGLILGGFGLSRRRLRASR